MIDINACKDELERAIQKLRDHGADDHDIMDAMSELVDDIKWRHWGDIENGY